MSEEPTLVSYVLDFPRTKDGLYWWRVEFVGDLLRVFLVSEPLKIDCGTFGGLIDLIEVWKVLSTTAPMYPSLREELIEKLALINEQLPGIGVQLICG